MWPAKANETEGSYRDICPERYLKGGKRKAEQVNTDMNKTKCRSLWRPTHWFIPAEVEYRAELLNAHKTHTKRTE